MIKAAMLSRLRVRDVMTEAVMLLRSEMSADEAWEHLHAHGVTGAPVLDAKGRLVGILSNADLADPRRRAPGASRRVGDLMTRLVYAVRADDTVLVAVRLMAEEHIHRVVAVNEDGGIAGIVVPMDIVRALAQHVEAHLTYVDLRTLSAG
jgi:CBS-domain-containing membrane protein